MAWRRDGESQQLRAYGLCGGRRATVVPRSPLRRVHAQGTVLDRSKTGLDCDGAKQELRYKGQ